MSLVQIWMLGTAIVVGGLMLWAFAPILIPLLLVAGGLGLVAAGIVALARCIERRRNSRGRLS